MLSGVSVIGAAGLVIQHVEHGLAGHPARVDAVDSAGNAERLAAADNSSGWSTDGGGWSPRPNDTSNNSAAIGRSKSFHWASYFSSCPRYCASHSTTNRRSTSRSAACSGLVGSGGNDSAMAAASSASNSAASNSNGEAGRPSRSFARR